MAQSAVAARKAASLKVGQQEKLRISPPITDTIVVERQAQDKQQDSRKKRRRLDDASIVKTEETQNLKLKTGHEEVGSREILHPVSLISTEHTEPEASKHADQVTTSDIPLPKLAKELVWEEDYTAVNVKLEPGEVLLVVGECELWVRRGTIRVLGATIHASTKAHRLLLPVPLAVPPIEALSNPFGPSIQYTELHISSCASGLRQLQRLEPRFSRMFQRNGGILASFKILGRQDATRTKMLVFDSTCQSHIAKLLEGDKPPTVIICGAKNTGKSTFSRFLSNSFLSRKYLDTGLAYLDLDPGQPEYSVPADLSLLHIKTFNLSQPYAHPILANGIQDKVIRQHHYGHISPREDLDGYLRCVADLHHRYTSELEQSGCPLIVNTCGWTQGSGLDLIDSLEKIIRPSHAVLITSPEADELSNSVQHWQTELLAIQGMLNISGPCSSADLRSMQHCSYFHVEDVENGHLHWASNALIASKPLSLSYDGDHRVISAVLLLGDHINFEMLEDAIDKTVLALIAVEDSSILSAISDVSTNGQENGPGDEESDMGLEPNSMDSLNSEDSDHLPEQNGSYILKFNGKGLPFLTTKGNVNLPLDPSRTRSLGQVLLSGIDHEQKLLKVHTPISPTAISSCVEQGTTLILVRGQLGMPEWAYIEQYNLIKAMQEDIAMLKELNRGDVSDDRLNFDVSAWARRTPYIEHLDSQILKSRSKVRRLRRNFASK